jgi:anaerobic magnesium-protoporphyrin IX monomethyl ester cyclase
MTTSKAKVVLINPPLPEGVTSHPFFPPLGIAYMAAVLDQNNVEVKVYDCPVCQIDHEKLKAELASDQPTMVGIGSFTSTIDSALESARVAKEACPDAKVLMGGVHASFADKQILAEEKAVDIVVRGEGEETIVELLDQSPEMQKINDIKGITFRKDDQIIQTPNRPLIHDLDALPHPAYKFLPVEKYKVTGRKLLPIITSRGCTFQCSFCVASKMFGARLRTRSAKNVLDELEWLKNEQGAEGISFQDDTFTLDKQRTIDICDGMIDRKINLPWGCGTRTDTVTKKVLAKMRKAGCNEVAYGVDAGAQKIRDAFHKEVSTQQCEKAIKWAKEEGIFVTTSVILGYPGETRETLQESLDFIRRVEPDEVWLCHATPFPGTELREIIIRNGWKMEPDWKLYNTMNPIFEDPLLPSSEIAKMRKDFYNKFYGPKYIFRQAVKGYFKGNLYSKIMTRTAANYMLWRIKARL